MAEKKEPVPFRENCPPRIHRTNITTPITTGISRSALVDSQISISPMFIGGCPSQNPERAFFHFLGLSR
jgi:hypothetical protein